MVYGTRPEAVKLWKVVEELRRCGVEPMLYATGQHTSLLRGTPAEDALKPNVQLGLSSGNDPMWYVDRCAVALDALFRAQRPDVIVVQGDTASAYAGALAGKTLGIPVAHVEAGIRTGDFDDPWPEEGFRIGIDRIATRWYCPTSHAKHQLQGEPEPPESGRWKLADQPIVTGNTGIDALYSHTRPVEHPQKVQDRVLITLHRRESFGDPLRDIVTGICRGVIRYSKLEFVWPTHPNPKVQAIVPHETWPNFVVQGPMDMIPFAKMLASSRCVITDSGGVQEESAALGVPCIVAREKTDRPESVELNLAKVVGRTESGILAGLDWALGYKARCTPSLCFGDGHAAPKIVQHLLGD